MSSRIIIHAPNVHSGGGYSLLLNLLQAIPPERNCLLMLDERMKIPESIKQQHEILFVKPTILGRLKGEILLRRYARGALIFSFGNLPPLVAKGSGVMLFIQNRYLITQKSLKAFSFKAKLRIIFERAWIGFAMTPSTSIVVQTDSMKRDLLRHPRFSGNQIDVFPFFDLDISRVKKTVNHEANDLVFMYPASGDPHKNHKNLVLAWHDLAKVGAFPTLKITLNELTDSNLINWIKAQIKRHNLKIDNLGVIDDKQVNDCLSSADALIYPSLFESFGIPLAVANFIKVPILASELDYVRDIVDPEQTFDPESPVSIARAVLRFTGGDADRRSIRSSAEFFKFIDKFAEFN